MHRSRLPGPLKAAARTASSTFGKTTAGERDLPHFLVIGAQRCGTTSLYRTLALHPQVIPPVFEKGIHYFDTADNFARGLTWYRGHFPLSWTARRRGGAGYRTGEASPYYMFHPTAIERIARVLPEVRLVVMLRDPVERAFSAHKQETARGFETETFERALALEPSRLAGEVDRMRSDACYQSFSHQHHAYVARGEYAKQLERVHQHFPRDQVMVLDADSYFVHPDEQWQQLLQHLRLDPWIPSAFEHANSKPSQPMPQDLRHQLDDHFHDHDRRLADILGYPPSWRR